MESSDKSDDGQAQFLDAINRCDLATAVKLCEEQCHLCAEGAAYVIKNKPFRFTINFIQQISHISRYTLVELCRSGSVTIVEAVLEEVDFSRDDLMYAIPTCTLMRSPKSFNVLLNKLPRSFDQEYTIERGIARLFNYEHTDYIEPLLAAIEGTTSKGKSLKDIAIQRIFHEAVWKEDDIWVKRFYNHPAITPKIYFDDLYKFSGDEQKSLFGWLLDAADHDDLQVARKELDGYWKPNVKLSELIDQALLTAKPGGTRHSTWQEVETSKDVVGGVIHSLPTGYSDVDSDNISDCYTDYNDEYVK